MARGRNRLILALLPLLASLQVLTSGPDLSDLQTRLERIVSVAASGRPLRGDFGVALIHIESDARLTIHGDRRFPMASVYKLPIAIELLTQIAQGMLALDRTVFIGPSDIRACCNLSRHHPNGGVSLSAGELLELMIVESDNTAADAVLKLVGGPAVVESRMRALGFEAINVNRYEGDIAFEMDGVVNPPPQALWTLELQRRLVAEVPPAELRAARASYTSDPRDTSTPADMALLLARLHLGKLLPRVYTDLLLDLMARAKTGPKRLKALLPPDTVVAHKTGTTDVVINDVGIITLPGDAARRGHLVLAVFAMNGRSVGEMQQTIAKVSGAAYEFFTGRPLPPPVKPKPPPKKKRRGG